MAAPPEALSSRHVLLPDRLDSLPEKGAGAARAQLHAPCLVTRCGPLIRMESSPIRLLGDRTVQEIVVLPWETAAELAKERTQAQRAMGIAVLLDG